MLYQEKAQKIFVKLSILRMILMAKKISSVCKELMFVTFDMEAALYYASRGRSRKLVCLKRRPKIEKQAVAEPGTDSHVRIDVYHGR